MKFKGKEKTRGITLIALIITIIVMLILAGVSINAIVGDNGIVTKSMEASFKNLMAQYKEDADSYVLNKQIGTEDYSTDLIFANDTVNTYFTKQWVNVNALYNYTLSYDKMSNVTTIESDNYKSHLSVYAGSLTWFTSESDLNSNEVKWCIDLGIRVFIDGYGFYIKKDDGSYGFEVYSDGTYSQYEDGVWMCSPDLEGFNTANTYYLTYGTTDTETPTIGTEIYQDVPNGWYDYNNKKWANVATVSNAHMSYLVWIPRYAYQIVNGTVDIKFINQGNIYIDESGNEYTLDDLGGYLVPDAFSFDGQELAGIWVSKYEVSDPREPTGFNATSDSESITVTAITWQGSSSATSDTSVVEGADVEVTISGNNYTDSYKGQLPYTFEGLQSGKTYTVTVTTPTYYSEDMTLTKNIKTTEGTVAELTNPDLSGFNLDNTYYVKMDSTTPTVYSDKITTVQDSIYDEKQIATNAPEGWYDYSSRNWANIVTIGDDGTAAYWVWVPRYEYKVYTDQNSVDIVFISANQTEADDGYIIPDAFDFGGKAVSGLWCAKYEVSNIKIPTGFATKVTSDGINISGITYNGTSTVSTGTMPNTGIAMTCTNSAGTVVSQGTITISTTSGYTISGLQPGTYTISLTIPYAYSDPQSGETTYATVKSTVSVPASGGIANAPDVSGFVNSDSTYAYYLVYPANAVNDTGGRVGDRITSTSTAPSDWYDYTNNKWANIIVSDTPLTVGSNLSSYSNSTNINIFVWIPRYEYKVDANANTVHTIFLTGTSTSTDSGYSIPDAFKFGETELTGFWCAKYEVSLPE